MGFLFTLLIVSFDAQSFSVGFSFVYKFKILKNNYGLTGHWKTVYYRMGLHTFPPFHPLVPSFIVQYRNLCWHRHSACMWFSAVRSCVDCVSTPLQARHRACPLPCRSLCPPLTTTPPPPSTSHPCSLAFWECQVSGTAQYVNLSSRPVLEDCSQACACQ